MGSPRSWLARAPTPVFVGYAIAAAFSTYFCMYAFRKPFAAAAFEGEIAGIDLKIALVLSQVIGYAISKLVGIGFVSGVSPSRRAVTIVALISIAELALLAFGALPPAGKLVAIFCNGLPLGAVWGLVFSFLEGRRTSEILGAGLSTSYIFASGAVKAVGKALLDAGVPEAWMPALTGALFFPPLLLAVAALRQLPPPSEADQRARTPREPMTAAQRRTFFARYWPGLVALTFLYVFLTAYRDFRDNFAVEILGELGEGRSSVLAFTEIWVALLVLACLAAIYLIRDNRRAFFVIHGLMFAGTATIAAATFAFEAGWIGGLTWMTTIGVGLYLGYVPYGCVLFDRLIASTRLIGTAVFMIYVTDALGYVGSIGVLLVKNFGAPQSTWLPFFVGFSYLCAAICCACFLLSALYFRARLGGRADASPW